MTTFSTGSDDGAGVRADALGVLGAATELTTLELKLADRSAFSVEAAQTAAGGGSRVARDGQRQRLTSA